MKHCCNWDWNAFKNILKTNWIYNHNISQYQRVLISQLFITDTFWRDTTVSFFFFNFRTLMDKINGKILRILVLFWFKLDLYVINCRKACVNKENLQLGHLPKLNWELGRLILKFKNFLVCYKSFCLGNLQFWLFS